MQRVRKAKLRGPGGARTLGSNDSHVDALTALGLADAAYYPDQLDQKVKEEAPGWTVAWRPVAAVSGIYAYIAYNGTDQYVVAIRGSILGLSWASFYNWFEVDLDVLEQEPWDYPRIGGTEYPKISQGAANGLLWLSQLQGKSGDGVLSFLLRNAIGAKISIGVTGHSLGGGLATAVALWLRFQIGTVAKKPIPLLFPVYTFAAPTAGNAQFAKLYDALFPATWRYYNRLDVVPRFGLPSLVATAGYLYLPQIDASQCGVIYDGVDYDLPKAFIALGAAIFAAEEADGFWDGWELERSAYTQTNSKRGTVELNSLGKRDPNNPGKTPCDKFFNEVAWQHSLDTYRAFLTGAGGG